jgi:hypothetical protein
MERKEGFSALFSLLNLPNGRNNLASPQITSFTFYFSSPRPALTLSLALIRLPRQKWLAGKKKKKICFF